MAPPILHSAVNGHPLPPQRDLNFPEIDTAIRSLTERQRSILAWIAFGKNNTEIASLFGLCSNSIERETSTIFSTVDSGNRHKTARLYFFWLSETFTCRDNHVDLEERSCRCPLQCSRGTLPRNSDGLPQLENYPLPNWANIGLRRIDLLLGQLNPRQLAMLAWIAHGATNPRISQTFELGRKTVEREVSGILEALGVESRHAAAAAFLHWSCCQREP